MKLFRRKKKFIDFKTQLMIAIEVVLHSILFPIMLAFILFVPPFAAWFSDSSIADHQAMAYALWEMNASKWPLIIGLILFIGLLSILFSHPLVGPAYRFKLLLKSLINRDLTAKIKLRKHDYLKEIETGFNSLIDTLRSDIGLTVEKMAAVTAQLEKLEGALASAPEADQQILKAMRDEVAAVQKVFSAYKV